MYVAKIVLSARPTLVDISLDGRSRPLRVPRINNGIVSGQKKWQYTRWSTWWSATLRDGCCRHRIHPYATRTTTLFFVAINRQTLRHSSTTNDAITAATTRRQCRVQAGYGAVETDEPLLAPNGTHTRWNRPAGCEICGRFRRRGRCRVLFVVYS
jgi:hypothetical protein